MNNERDIHNGDDLVSAAYREHSTECAPERLNQTILAMAKGASGKSSKITPLFRAWTKPLALAATVAFSFAIVLEVTRVPQNTPIPAGPVASPSDSVREEFAPRISSTVEDARNQARLRDGFNQEESLLADPQAASRLDSRKSTFVADAPAELAEAEIISQLAAGSDAAGNSNADRPDRAKRDLSRDLQQADDEVAEMVARPAAAFAMALEKKESDATASCAANERATNEDWLACIDKLRRDGAIEDADREYAEYLLKFPAK